MFKRRSHAQNHSRSFGGFRPTRAAVRQALLAALVASAASFAFYSPSRLLSLGVSRASIAAGNAGQAQPDDLQIAAPLATITVNSLADTVSGSDGKCTLREAIAAANTNTASGGTSGECAAGNGADTISFSVLGTITLTGTELTIASDLTITNPSAPTLIVSGNNTSRVLRIDSGTVTVSGLTIAHGKPSSGAGGAISNAGNLTINASTITNSSSVGNGGGIQSNSVLTISNSTIQDNSSSVQGGGLRLLGTATISNSTISGNSGSSGGGISSTATLTISNTTISNNSVATSGGGISRSSGTATLNNNIIAGNFRSPTTRDDLNGAFNTISAFNLVGDGTGMTGITTGTNDNQVGSSGSPINPLLGPLQYNGGHTQTHALLTGSPAIDKGDSTLTPDQRGLTRPFDDPAIANAVGNGADIGSVELQQGENLLVNSLADTDDGVCDAASCTLREAITTANLATTQNAIYFSVTGAIARTGEQLTINGDVTINGPGARLLTVRGSRTSRVLQINASKRASIYGLTISGGVVPPASGSGGGIQNLGLLTIGNCFISDNQAADGGGISNNDFLSITDSTVSGNVAAGVGGGIWNADYLFISNTTITGNLADSGGGIDNRFTVLPLTVTNTTITKNHADSDNSGNGFGGGISHVPNSLSNLTLHNSIVAENFVGSGTSTRGDIGGGGAVDTRSSFNLIGVNTGFSGPTHGSNGNQIGTSASPLDPFLSPLQFNGGATPTQTLLPNSPAIDKGNSAFSDDQRGLPRPVDIASIVNATGGNSSDIGAVEVTASQNLLVNSFADTNDNVCDASQCTLREAVNAANANADFNLITFTFPVSGAITLTGSQLVLASNLAINGPVTTVLGISGNNTSRVFLAEDNQTVSLSNLTVTNGNVGTGSGGGIALDPGADLTINNCTISNNQAGVSGGGIRNNSGTLFINNSIISGNSSGQSGGGIASNSANPTLTSINHSTISGNSANDGSGGGIFSNRTLLINNSTISGNSVNVGTGGGIWSSGTLTVSNSTISANTATGDGGGFSNATIGIATLTNTTITNNHSHNVPNDGQCCAGGGVSNTFGQSVTLHNCIVAGNFTGPGIFRPSDVGGSFDTNSSFNLIGNGDASGGSLINGTNGNQIGTALSPINPLLGPLANNGGPTNTHAPLAGSPALDKGFSLLLTDQRGLRRPIDLPFINNASPRGSDIGAFELQSLEVLTVNSLADTDDGTCDASNCTLREAVNAANANADFSLIRFTVTGTIMMTGGQFVLNTPLAIDGPGASLLTINGNNTSRGFLVNGSSVVAFSGLTVTNGNGDTGFGSTSSGGAIRLNPGTHATVNNCTISGNRVNAFNTFGGGIHNERGTLVINQSTLSGNSSTRGGGVGIASSSPLTVINNSTISGNSATRGGAGIHTQGLLEINYSTINGNSESFDGGGGIFNGSPGNLTTTNCTVSGNSTVSEGGGIDNAGTLTLTRTTIANNHADADNNGTGGGGGVDSTGTITLLNTIVAGNFKGSGTNTSDDVLGVLNANSSFNLIGNGTNMMGLTNGTNNNQVGTAANPINARLAPLFTNGGPTQTHALLPGSPALDAGSNDLQMPLTDQRGLGFPRAADGPDAGSSTESDIGAFEAYPSIEDITDKSTNKNSPRSFNFNVGDASQGISSVIPASSNTTLVPNANLVITGTSGTRTLQITPAANQTGQTTITITVTAPNGQMMSDSFVLTVNDVANTVQFSATGYSIGEGAFNATINVTRSGDTSGTATIDFATSDNTASQRTDYTIGAGTLAFAPGETSKTFEVLIVDDLYVEGAETLNLSLSDPTGNVVVGSPSVAVLTIADNDSGSPTINPLDNADQRFFVRQHFYDFLSRLPDQGGFDFWVGQITQCGSNQTCLNNKRLDVSNAFFFELEFQQTGAYVYRLYRAAFGNTQPFPNPDNSNAPEANKLPGYAVFARDRARVVGGANLAQGQQTLANAFVQRLEFLAKYPAHLDGPAFIDAVVNNITSDLGVNLTAQKPALLTLFNSGGRGAVMYRLADDAAQTNPINNRALIDAEYNRAFVATQYFGYLRRDSDIGGFLFWLGQVNSAPLRSLTRQRAMVCAFITSAEYQQRFSSVTTHTNAECQ